MEERLNIYVGCTLFRINKSTMQRYPETLLGSMSKSSEYYNKDHDCFYFDRNPELFNTILDFYRNDAIHLPTHICGWLWKSELQFWKIPLTKISECCFSAVAKYCDNENLSANLKAAFTVQETPRLSSMTYLRRLRHRFWLFLDEPSSSKCARVFSIIYLTIVVVSATLPCLATLPSLREEHVNATTLAWYAYMYDIKLWINFNNPKEVMFVTTDNPLWIFYLNLVVIVFFSLETISRFLACPCRCKFFREWLNILDIILLLGMWINHGLAKTPPLVFLENEKLAYLVCAFDALSVLRLLRLFRLAKQYNSLKILYFALKASCKELLLLLITFLVLGWVFANLVYYVEIRESETFPDMLVAMWWAVVTMTTVGYGDMYPRSRLGHIVGSMCAMTGLLVLAMPIAVIAGKFNDMYMKNKEREFYNTLHNETVHTRVTVKEENKVEPYPVKCDVIKRKKVFLQQVKEENKVEPYIPC